MNDEGTEGDWIGWDYSSEDTDDEMTEFDHFCEYHGIDEGDYSHFSNNQISNMWWNFRKFGKSK